MKTFYYQLIACLVVFLGLVSCSGGDDNGGSGSGGNTDPKSSVNITTSSPTVPQSGASASVSFTVSGNWTASSNQSWCHVSPTSGNQGTTTITVTCDDNDTYDERNATVTIKCGNASSSITVTQKQKDALLVTSNKVEVDAVGGEATIEVKANVDYTYSVEESAKSWIGIVGTRALTTKNIVLNISENEEQTSREGKITISSSEFKEEVTVYQQGSTPSIVLTTKEFTVASSGETIKVELKSNTSYTIQMPNVKWITESSTRAMSSYTHYFKVEENTSYDSRSAEIIFKDEANGIEEKVTVNQLQKDAIVLAKNEYVVDYMATQLDFSVKSNVELEVSTSDSWIKQVSTRALTEKKLYFDIEENTSESERTGYIYITSGDLKQTISVTQRKKGDIPYITFTSDKAQSLFISLDVSTLEYSVNGSDWFTLVSKDGVLFGGEYGDLRLRGKSSNGTKGATISFGRSTKVACKGDIRTLMNYEKYENINKSGGFSFLFKNCYQLTSAPELPLTSSVNYNQMFMGCTSLTEAPELPATSDVNYNQMFMGCTSLIEAPELPATTSLSKNCYEGMFWGCTSLIKAPKLLPATTLNMQCYSYMFKGCTSLTKAPELPATTLSFNCYTGMFEGCTSLTEAPELPATNLADYCYFGMFSGCKALTKAPELPATNLAIGCYKEMFTECTSLSEAPGLSATNLASSCYGGMFSGCKALTKAPELPATNLAIGCYKEMFTECTSLSEAPGLSATNLASSCYGGMFSGCKALTKAPELPATNLAIGCYKEMFTECKTLTKAPELPATTLAEYCYYEMFEGCTSLIQAPELPATNLANYCYAFMFVGCSKLNYIKMMATDISAESCLNNWVNGVSSSGTFVKNKDSTWNKKGNSGIPSGWTVLTE